MAAAGASAAGFEVSPCSLPKAPLKLNREQPGQEGLSHSCCQSVFLPKAGSACTCVISDGRLRVLLYSHSPVTFLPAFAVFSMSFFLLGNALTYYFLKNLILFPANSPSGMASQSLSALFSLLCGRPNCFFASPVCKLDLPGFCLVFGRNVVEK